MDFKPDHIGTDRSPDETRSLLQRLLADDSAAWRDMVNTYTGLMLATARRTFERYNYQADNQDVEDAAAVAWKNLLDNNRRVVRQCLEKGQFIQMLYTLTRNRAIDIIRSRKPNTFPLEPEAIAQLPEAYQSAGTDMDQARLLAAFQKLSGREQTVLRLFYLQEKKYRDIEKLTGIAMNTIGPTISRALAKIRKAYGRPQ